LKTRSEELQFCHPRDFNKICREDAYYLAVHYNWVDVLKAVLDSKNTCEWNALHIAVVYGGLDTIKAFSDDDIHQYGHIQVEFKRTPLHLAFQRCDAEAALTVSKRECWRFYNGEDKLLLLYITVKAFAFDGRASPYCEWFGLIEWLQKRAKLLQQFRIQGQTRN
jgi:hypothetical protein